MAIAEITSAPSKMNFGKILEMVSPAIPIVGGIAQNIIQGINTRKARLYDSPKEQVKRFQQAGLPMASTSRITTGGGFTTQTSNLGTDNLPQNLGSSLKREIDRKQIALLKEQIRSAGAKASIDVGEAKNVLNPAGTFENTNQGITAMQTQAQQTQALNTAKTVNKYLDTEKYQQILKTGSDIKNIEAQTANHLVQNGILIHDKEIRGVLSKYQEGMSLGQLQNLVLQNENFKLRNKGTDIDNKAKQVALDIEYATQMAKIQIAKNQAIQSGQDIAAKQFGLLLTQMSMPSTKAYYTIRRGMDDATMAKPNMANTLLYLGMFQPNTSNYNLGQIGQPIYTGMNRWWDATN